MHYSRSHNAVIRVYDESGYVIETHEHTRSISKSGDALHEVELAILQCFPLNWALR